MGPATTCSRDSICPPASAPPAHSRLGAVAAVAALHHSASSSADGDRDGNLFGSGDSVGCFSIRLAPWLARAGRVALTYVVASMVFLSAAGQCDDLLFVVGGDAYGSLACQSTGAPEPL